MSGFSIPIAADTREAVMAANDLANGFAGVAESLDKVGAAGGDADGQLTRSMEQAQRATASFATSTERAVQAGDGLRPMALEGAGAFEQLAGQAQRAGKASQEAGESAGQAGQKMEEGGKLGEAAMMNVGFSAMQAGTLFTDGIGGMASQLGTFAAFMGPSLAAVEGPLAALAWPITLAGVALAALSGLMQDTGSSAEKASPAVKDFVTSMQDGTAAADSFDDALRKWAQDATDFGGQALSEVADAAKAAGVEFSDYAESITSKSIPAMAAQERQLSDLKQQYVEERAAITGSSLADADKRLKLGEQLDAIDKLNGSLGTQINNVKQAESAERVLASEMGLTLGQYRDYGKVLQTAEDAHVKLTKAQKDQIAVDIAGGDSASKLSKYIKDYADAVQKAKDLQDAWNKAVVSDFSSAASASDDWAKSNKVDLDQVTTNLNEAADLADRLPGDIEKSLGAGLSQMGLQLLESLPNGQQILDQIGMDPGTPGAQALIAAANRAGGDTGKGYADGVTGAGPAVIPVTADASSYNAVIARIKNNPPAITVPVTAAVYLGGKRVF